MGWEYFFLDAELWDDQLGRFLVIIVTDHLSFQTMNVFSITFKVRNVYKEESYAISFLFV